MVLENVGWGSSPYGPQSQLINLYGLDAIDQDMADPFGGHDFCRSSTSARIGEYSTAPAQIIDEEHADFPEVSNGYRPCINDDYPFNDHDTNNVDNHRCVRNRDQQDQQPTTLSWEGCFMETGLESDSFMSDPFGPEIYARGLSTPSEQQVDLQAMRGDVIVAKCRQGYVEVGDGIDSRKRRIVPPRRGRSDYVREGSDHIAPSFKARSSSLGADEPETSESKSAVSQRTQSRTTKAKASRSKSEDPNPGPDPLESGDLIISDVDAVQAFLYSRFEVLLVKRCKPIAAMIMDTLLPFRTKDFPYSRRQTKTQASPSWWPPGVDYESPHRMGKCKLFNFLAYLVALPLNNVSEYKNLCVANGECVQWAQTLGTVIPRLGYCKDNDTPVKEGKSITQEEEEPERKEAIRTLLEDLFRVAGHTARYVWEEIDDNTSIRYDSVDKACYHINSKGTHLMKNENKGRKSANSPIIARQADHNSATNLDGPRMEDVQQMKLLDEDWYTGENDVNGFQEDEDESDDHGLARVPRERARREMKLEEASPTNDLIQWERQRALLSSEPQLQPSIMGSSTTESSPNQIYTPASTRSFDTLHDPAHPASGILEISRIDLERQDRQAARFGAEVMSPTNATTGFCTDSFTTHQRCPHLPSQKQRCLDSIQDPIATFKDEDVDPVAHSLPGTLNTSNPNFGYTPHYYYAEPAQPQLSLTYTNARRSTHGNCESITGRTIEWP